MHWKSIKIKHFEIYHFFNLFENKNFQGKKKFNQFLQIGTYLNFRAKNVQDNCYLYSCKMRLFEFKKKKSVKYSCLDNDAKNFIEFLPDLFLDDICESHWSWKFDYVFLLLVFFFFQLRLQMHLHCIDRCQSRSHWHQMIRNRSTWNVFISKPSFSGFSKMNIYSFCDEIEAT